MQFDITKQLLHVRLIGLWPTLRINALSKRPGLAVNAEPGRTVFERRKFSTSASKIKLT